MQQHFLLRKASLELCISVPAKTSYLMKLSKKFTTENPSTKLEWATPRAQEAQSLENILKLIQKVLFGQQSVGFQTHFRPVKVEIYIKEMEIIFCSRNDFR